jgi:glycosyltransferase involved in cell wall biosynthesis
VKVCASLILRNELHRYLEPCLLHLLEFVDEVCVLDNGSTDGWAETLAPALGADKSRVILQLDTEADREHGSMFVNHAARRQQLLDFTLTRSPDWILAVDADEFVADGAQLRRACETQSVDTLALCLQEVWNAYGDRLEIRQDGGWVEHDVVMLWQPSRIRQPLTIVDRGPATGRTPETLTHASRGHTCTALLHFGWANRAERADRHHRYVIADGGRFHNSRHLDSIMWPDEQVGVNQVGWPAALEPYRSRILQRTESEWQA